MPTNLPMGMSLPPVRHDPIVSDHDPSADPQAANARYRTYAMDKYDDLFEELEFRCQRAAMMHYHEANGYSRKCYYLELLAAILGAASVSHRSLLVEVEWHRQNNGGDYSIGIVSDTTGNFGLFGVTVASVLEFASKGSSNVLPTLCARCEGHKKAAVGWQRLSRLTRSYRIQLRNPALTVDDYMAWYMHLVAQRQLVSAIALVPSATYRAFNDPARVFANISKRRQMFLRYQQMFEGKLEAHDDYDDD